MFNKKPKIIELELSNNYQFMYENFLISTQLDAYLLLEEREGVIHTLKFNGSTIRYGSPNDEGRGAHPLSKFAPLTYGFYEVINSPWIKEQMVGNRIHPRHSDEMYKDKKHYIVCFKDVMFEATCRSYSLEKMNKGDVAALVSQQLEHLSE